MTGERRDRGGIPTSSVRQPLTDALTLDVGAGTAVRHPGAVRLDRARQATPHVVADVDRGGLPFRSNAFETVGAYDVVEHVEDLVAFVEEVHRVLKPGGRLLVTTPHYSCANAHTDPTHRRALGLRSFDYFADGHSLAYYSRARFRVRTATLFFEGAVLGRLLSRMARRWPRFYERRLAWVFPAWFLYFELEAVK
jgi:SAM-dependent methyltransferase